MTPVDQFRANAAARRIQVSASLDIGPAALENALDRILVRAAQSGTTAAAAAPPTLASSSTPPSTQPGSGVPPVVAGIALALGAGLLAVGVVTASGGEPAEVATPPVVTADVAVPTQPDLAPLPTVDPADSTPTSPSTSPSTSTAESTPPTSAERESDIPVLVPIDPAPIDPVPTPDPVPTVTVEPVPTTTTATTVAPPAGGESSPVLSPPPTTTCGGQGRLPPGPVLTAEADFDADGEADVIAFYSTSSGPAAVIRRSSEGLTEVGFIGEKPVGDLSSQASARAVRPGPTEQQIVLLFDALDDDGSSVWARPVGLSDCTPVGLDLPAEPEAPDGELWNGASFSDGGTDYGLLCVDEGSFTVLSFRSFSDVGARLSLEADTATLQIDEIDTVDGNGCWT